MSPVVPFVVGRQLFSDSPSSLSVSFAYLASVALTDEVVDKSTVGTPRADRRQFRRSACDRISVVASVHALAGTNASVGWQPVGVVQTTKRRGTIGIGHRSQGATSPMVGARWSAAWAGSAGRP